MEDVIVGIYERSNGEVREIIRECVRQVQSESAQETEYQPSLASDHHFLGAESEA